MKVATARRALQKRLKKLDLIKQAEQWANLAVALDMWDPRDLVLLEEGSRAAEAENELVIEATYLGKL